MRYVLLLQSELTSRALGSWLELLGEAPLKDSRDPRVVVWMEHSYWTVYQSYEHWVKLLEDVVGGQSQTTNPVTVLVDQVDPDQLSIIAPGSGWNNLLAMLVLTFPEFRWVFGVCSNSQIAAEEWANIKMQHALPTLFSRDISNPLFDPSGLREWIRRRTNEQLSILGDDLQLPERQEKEKAAVIDEEQSYIFFNGYCAYRFGFRADLVDTWMKMNNRFGQSAASPHPYWLLLEDMSLNFPDRETGIRLHKLDRPERARHCPRLDSSNKADEQSQYRVLITTGQTRPVDDTLKYNKAYLKEKAAVFGLGAVVLKPACGLFDLWKQAELMRCHGDNRLPGFAPNFRWPPEQPKPYNQNLQGHGAPGKLLVVAEMLIKRAETLKPDVKSVASAVLGATLATDALELTGGRTPTTAIEALSLKHQFEVMAECQFSGVEYHISVRPRIDEISNILEKSICLWFDETKRKQAQFNALMHILNQLVRILSEYNQFDEEQLCRNETRKLYHKLWIFRKKWSCFPLNYIFRLTFAYFDLLLSSFGSFLISIFCWLGGLGLIFWVLPRSPLNQQTISLATYDMMIPSGLSIFEQTCNNFHFRFENVPPSPSPTFNPLWEAVHRFFNHTMPPSDLGFFWQIITFFGIIAGIFHVGIFISYMYTQVTRK